MHYTGTIWRPPYEAYSLLLEATAGCTHHKCKFCTLYHDLPFKFRMSPREDIKSDLQEAQLWCTDPIAKLSAKLQGLPEPAATQRVFLTGANPFVLQTEHLTAIAKLIAQYLPQITSIGCFARVTDITRKSDAELSQLHRLGYDRITIGVETGDAEALAFMHKGYQPQDIIEQAARLDTAGIAYHFFYLAGISGAGRGIHGALESAKVFNQTHPKTIGSSMLTIFPESELYQEIQRGKWTEESELEKFAELKTLIENLNIHTEIMTEGASNLVRLHGRLPTDKQKLICYLEDLLHTADENTLRDYRTHLRHL